MKKFVVLCVTGSLIAAGSALAQEDMSCAAFADLDANAQIQALAQLEGLAGLESSEPADQTNPSTGAIETNADDPQMIADDVSIEVVAQICRDNTNWTVIDAVEQAQVDVGTAATAPASE